MKGLYTVPVVPSFYFILTLVIMATAARNVNVNLKRNPENGGGPVRIFMTSKTDDSAQIRCESDQQLTRLTLIPCSTMTECDKKRACLHKLNAPDHAVNLIGERGIPRSESLEKQQCRKILVPNNLINGTTTTTSCNDNDASWNTFLRGGPSQRSKYCLSLTLTRGFAPMSGVIECTTTTTTTTTIGDLRNGTLSYYVSGTDAFFAGDLTKAQAPFSRKSLGHLVTDKLEMIVRKGIFRVKDNGFLYQEEKVDVNCLVSQALFDLKQVTFFQVFENGTKDCVDRSLIKPSKFLTPPLFTVLTVPMTVSKDTVAFGCSANSIFSDGLVTEANFKFRMGGPSDPSIEGASGPSKTLKFYPSLSANQVNQTLTCVATGDPRPTITWKFEDNPISPSKYLQITTLRHDFKDRIESTLFLNGMTDNDKGRYSCVAVNFNQKGLNKTDERQFHVELEYRKPSIIRVNGKELTKNGKKSLKMPIDTSKLSCQATGLPAPTIQWKLNGKELLANDTAAGGLGGGYQVTQNLDQSLSILTLPEVDYGVVRVLNILCVATNLNCNDTDQIEFLVGGKTPPSIKGPKNRKIDFQWSSNDGQINVVDCTATGNPLPSITWRKVGMTDSISESYSIRRANSIQSFLILYGNRAGGTYMCSAMTPDIAVYDDITVTFLNQDEWRRRHEPWRSTATTNKLRGSSPIFIVIFVVAAGVSAVTKNF